MICEECGGEVTLSQDEAFLVCRECGLVQDRNIINKKKVARREREYSINFVNNGQKTTFNPRNLKRDQALKYHRLKKYDYIHRPENFNFDRLRKTFLDICRIINLPKLVLDRACYLFNENIEFHRKELLFHSGVILYMSIYQAVRERDFLISDREILAVFKNLGIRINLTLANKLLAEREVKKRFTTKRYFETYEQKLLANNPELHLANREIVQIWVLVTRKLQGHKPESLALGILYLCYKQQKVTLRELALMFDTYTSNISRTANTIRRVKA